MYNIKNVKPCDRVEKSRNIKGRPHNYVWRTRRRPRACEPANGITISFICCLTNFLTTVTVAVTVTANKLIAFQIYDHLSLLCCCFKLTTATVEAPLLAHFMRYAASIFGLSLHIYLLLLFSPPLQTKHFSRVCFYFSNFLSIYFCAFKAKVFLRFFFFLCLIFATI